MICCLLGIPALALAALLWARLRLILITVHGSSMEPTYLAGDRVLVRRGATPRTGKTVVFRAELRTPSDPPYLVKRIAAVAGERVGTEFAPAVADDVVPAGSLLVRGDNPLNSLDSRRLGYLTEADVLGLVVFAFRSHSARLARV